MLQRLFVKNVALIEELDVAFTAGFNVLTGETGAGKSIVIDAVNLVLGERASRELIKHGADKARVEAIFEIKGRDGLLSALEEMGLPCEEPGELLLSREMSAAGKNICRVNGALVNLATLKEITDQLVDVHGQHAHQSLLSKSRHMEYLDSFAQEEIRPWKEGVAAAAARYKQVQKELLEGFGSEEERAREMDMLRYQIQEIEKAGLYEGEEEALLGERKVLQNAARIMEAMEQGSEALSGEGETALSLVNAAWRQLQGIGELSAEYGALAQRLEEAYYALEDISYSLRDMQAGFEYDPQRAEQIEERLALYHGLKRKYGEDYEAIMGYLAASAERLEKLEGSEERRATLEQERRQAEEAYLRQAAGLTQARKAAAAALETGMVQELKELGFAHGDFAVAFHPVDGISSLGAERVEFLLSANAGEPLKPLEKVASGGEMSRIMLAMKAMFAKGDAIETLIFDEIDTGISGRIASVVGEKMVRIARDHQVLCVTHLPQIAAMADAHYLVEKSETDGHARTSLRALTLQERYVQVAAMMSGAGQSAAALEHAKELVDSCAAAKAEGKIG